MATITWTLKALSGPNADTEKTFADWGLSLPVISRQASTQDKATFNAVVALGDADAIFGYLDQAVIYRTTVDGETTTKVPWFSGVMTKLPRVIAPQTESIGYELSGGPWWYLSHCTYQAPWTAYLPGTSELGLVSRSMENLGQRYDGTQMDLGAFLGIALAYCVTCGTAQTPDAVVPYLIGTVDLNDLTVPNESVSNLTCAQMVQKVLQWAVDCAFVVDYSTFDGGGAPTVHVLPRASMTPASFAIGTAPLSKVSRITPRPDLQVPAVVLKFAVTTHIDNTDYVQQIVQLAPDDGNEQAYGALVADIPLDGGRATYQRASITTQTRPVLITDSVAMSWVKKKVTWLGAQIPGGGDKYDVSNVFISSIDTAIALDDPLADDPPDLDTLDRELLTGQVMPWMMDGSDTNGDEVKACKVVCTVVLGYSGTDADTRAFFNNDPKNPGAFQFEEDFTALDTATSDFSKLMSKQAGEAPPEGMAATLYAARSMLHWEGSIELTEEECSGAIALANTLNLTSGLTAWSTMAAQLNAITETTETGVTVVEFGPPVNLGVSELLDLFRAIRGRVRTYNADQRTSGDAATGQVDGHIHHQHGRHTAAPIPPGKPKAWDLAFRKTSGGGSPTWHGTMTMGTISKSPSSTDLISVTGAPDDATTTSSDGFWYLEGTLTTTSGVTTVTSIAMKSAAALTGGDYDTSLDAWTSGSYAENDGGTPPDGPNQTLFRYPIASVDWTSGSPVSTNLALSNLIIDDMNFDGIPAKYPAHAQAVSA